MKCSLLILSTFIDGELEPRKQGELEAHLVGCRRCQNGLEHLREEVSRVGGLARIHVPDLSVASLFEQLGLTDVGAPLPALSDSAVVRDAASPAPPWMGTEVGTALPWRSDTPRPARHYEPRTNLGGVPWTPSPPPTPPQGERPWEGGHPVGTPAEPSEESGESSVELAGTAQESAEIDAAHVDGHSGDGAMTEDETLPFDPDADAPPPATPAGPATWTSAGNWVGMPPPQPGGWYPPTPPLPRPGPIPVAPPSAPSPEPAPTWVSAAAFAPPPIESLSPVVAPSPPVPVAAELLSPTVADDPRPAISASHIPPPGAVAEPERVIPEETTVTPTSMLPPTELDAVDSLDAVDYAPAAQPPRRAPRTRGGLRFLERIRERVALQRALRTPAVAYDDSVEIVSGTGASPRNGAAHGHLQGSRGIALPDDSEAAVAVVDVTGSASPPRWTDHSDAVTETTVLPAPTPGPAAVYADFDDGHDVDAAADSPAPIAHFPSDAVLTRVDDIEPLQALRDDAMRRHGLIDEEVLQRRSRPRVHVDMTRVSAVFAAAALTSWRYIGGAASRVHVPLRLDRRALAGIAVVALLLVVGLAIGKRTTVATTPVTTQSQAPVNGTAPAGQTSAPALTQSQPAAPAQPAAMTVNDPAPLGAGATGVIVSGIRYGNHPGDFRIVLDMSGPGSPKTVVGFSDPQTLVVVFDATTFSGNLGSVPGNAVVTSASQLPSSTPGQIVIQFKLAHAVTRTQGYLSGPLRLVLDLH